MSKMISLREGSGKLIQFGDSRMQEIYRKLGVRHTMVEVVAYHHLKLVSLGLVRSRGANGLWSG